MSAFLRCLDEAVELGARELIISGGEPLMRPGMVELAMHAARRDVYVTLSTNGSLLDHDAIGRLGDAGVDFVHLSLPAAREEAYDEMTGTAGNLPRVRNAVALMKKANFHIRVKTVLTARNWGEVADVADFCADNGVDCLQVAQFVLSPLGRGGFELVPPDDRVESILRALRNKAEQRRELVIVPPPTHVWKWRGSDEIVACGGVKESLTILDNGDITFCEALRGRPEFTFGNIRDIGLKSLWRSALPDTAMERRRAAEPCAEYDFLPKCGTGCFAFSLMSCGDPYGPDPRCFKSGARIEGEESWAKIPFTRH